MPRSTKLSCQNQHDGPASLFISTKAPDRLSETSMSRLKGPKSPEEHNSFQSSPFSYPVLGGNIPLYRGKPTTVACGPIGVLNSGSPLLVHKDDPDWISYSMPQPSCSNWFKEWTSGLNKTHQGPFCYRNLERMKWSFCWYF